MFVEGWWWLCWVRVGGGCCRDLLFQKAEEYEFNKARNQENYLLEEMAQCSFNPVLCASTEVREGVACGACSDQQADGWSSAVAWPWAGRCSVSGIYSAGRTECDSGGVGGCRQGGSEWLKALAASILTLCASRNTRRSRVTIDGPLSRMWRERGRRRDSEPLD